MRNALWIPVTALALSAPSWAAPPSIFDVVGRLAAFAGVPAEGARLVGTITGKDSGPCSFYFASNSLGDGDVQALVKAEAGRTGSDGVFEHLLAGFGLGNGSRIQEFSEKTDRIHVVASSTERIFVPGSGAPLGSRTIRIRLNLTRLSDGSFNADLSKTVIDGWKGGYSLSCHLPRYGG